MEPANSGALEALLKRGELVESTSEMTPDYLRELKHTLPIDHLSHTRGLRFNQRGVGFHLDRLAHRAELEGDVNLGVAGNLQYDSSLYKCTESRQ